MNPDISQPEGGSAPCPSNSQMHSQNRCASIAVLPFENLSGSADDALLAVGFVHDLIFELARFSEIGIIAAESTFALQPARLEDADIGRRLAVDYLLKGSLRRSVRSLRLSVQLVHLSSGHHLWAERYDVAAEEMFALQDEIAAKVANALTSRIDQSILIASRNRHFTKLSVYECWLRGMECLQRGTITDDDEARQYFEQALSVDPQYARAQAGLSLSHFNEWSCQAWGCWEVKEKAAYECALRAEALDPDDPIVQMILGKIEQYRRQHALAEARYYRVQQIAPNNAFVLIQITLGLALLGEAELAVQLGERALKLNPLCPAWWFYYQAVPHFVMGDYSRSVELGLKTPVIVTDGPAYLAAAYAHLGDMKRAHFQIEEFRKVFAERISMGRTPEPGEAVRWLLHVNPFRREEDLQHFVDGLRMAGLEDDLSKSVAPSATAWPVGNIFRKEGELWTVCYEHEVAHVSEIRGLLDIAKLLEHPGGEVHCIELAGQTSNAASGVEVLDEQAKRSYRCRLREIESELADAEAANDPGRCERIEEERERLLEEMRKATGLGGRDRKMGDTTERARTTVTWRIRHAIKKLALANPTLAKHLNHSIKTGVFCSYSPEKETRWFL